MNFKIENNYINITNYPYIEKHFENMANQGWLIHKIIGENIFIYKRIMPEELDFAISLYEIETAFTKKAKEELKEFQSVCQSAGWNYATRSTDLHIYFKEKGSKVVDIETDDEEEFITIEKIVKKRLLGMYLTGIVALFVSYVVLFDRIANVELIRNGLLQVLSPFFPLLLIFSIGQIIRIKRFLKVNGKNIETGEELEFQNSKFYFEKAIYFLTTIIFIILIVYTVWIGFILKNNDTLTSILPTLIAISIASIYRILAKPSSRDSGNKKIWFFTGIIIILIMVPLLNGSRAQKIIRSYNNLDPNKFKVLTPEAFGEEEKVYYGLEGKVLQDTSFLIPKSYGYDYMNGEGQYIKTEYSSALNEDLAKTLVNQYIKRAKEDSNRYIWSPVFSLEGDKENLWNLDEVYYLNNKKTEIVIREGKEVFYLRGKDFSDPELIKITKNQLDL